MELDVVDVFVSGKPFMPESEVSGMHKMFIEVNVDFFDTTHEFGRVEI